MLDSTPLYDAVATMGTVTLVRSGIRGLLAPCEGELEEKLRGVLARDDDNSEGVLLAEAVGLGPDWRRERFATRLEP